MRIVRDERGLSSVEYAVLFTVLVVGLLGVWKALGRSVDKQVEAGTQTFNAALSAQIHPVEPAGASDSNPSLSASPARPSGDVPARFGLNGNAGPAPVGGVNTDQAAPKPSGTQPQPKAAAGSQPSAAGPGYRPVERTQPPGNLGQVSNVEQAQKPSPRKAANRDSESDTSGPAHVSDQARTPPVD